MPPILYPPSGFLVTSVTLGESGAVTSLGSAGVLPVVGVLSLPAASIAVAVIVALAPIDPLGRLTV